MSDGLIWVMSPSEQSILCWSDPGEDVDQAIDFFEDNCQGLANPDQANLDGDAFGDTVDDDKDGDGVDNTDPFPVDFSEQYDTDADGVGDNAVTVLQLLMAISRL